MFILYHRLCFITGYTQPRTDANVQDLVFQSEIITKNFVKNFDKNLVNFI